MRARTQPPETFFHHDEADGFVERREGRGHPRRLAHVPPNVQIRVIGGLRVLPTMAAASARDRFS
jgi:hypothetical protein